jgi:type IV pilus assembly protein PilV
MRPTCKPRGERGFSLVEVMVALIVICVGLLGIAKLEALMLSSSGTSRVRALVALQAASLADAMHADRDYWAAAPNPLAITATEAAGATQFQGTLAPTAGTANCLDAVCTSQQMAEYDLWHWGVHLADVLQNSTASINCSPVNSIVSCTISMTWNENTVAANSQEAQAGTPAAFQTQTYTLVVQP